MGSHSDLILEMNAPVWRLPVRFTAKLNNVDPQAWLTDVLGRIAWTPQSQFHELLPRNWKDDRRRDQAA